MIIIIGVALASIAYFIWLYNELGFIWTPLCLFSWAFALLGYGVSGWVLLMLLDN